MKKNTLILSFIVFFQTKENIPDTRVSWMQNSRPLFSAFAQALTWLGQFTHSYRAEYSDSVLSRIANFHWFLKVPGDFDIIQAICPFFLFALTCILRAYRMSRVWAVWFSTLLYVWAPCFFSYSFELLHNGFTFYRLDFFCFLPERLHNNRAFSHHPLIGNDRWHSSL